MADSEWTIATLKEHLERRMDDEEKAVAIASKAMKSELRGLNELRAMANDGLRTYFPRKEAESESKRLDERVDALASRVDELKSSAEERIGRRAGISIGWSIAIAAFGLCGFAFGVFAALRNK